MSVDTSTPPAYKPLTLDDLADVMAGSPPALRWRLVAEFLEEYSWEPMGARPELLEREPRSVGDERWDVFLAALAEHLSARDGRGAPSGADGRALRQFWSPFNPPAARTDAVVRAPAAFRRRGVFVAAHELDVA